MIRSPFRPFHHKKLDSAPVFATETLEPRRLMAWGGWPIAAGLDREVTSYPSINGAGQTIAILDSGVDYTNPVFGRSGFGRGYKIRAGYNFVDNNSNFMDADGHGTAVAAIAAGNGYTYRSHHYQGTASGAQIAALKIDDGSGNITVDEYSRALQWVIGYKYKYNITAVNISEGGNNTFAQKFAGSDYGDLLAQLKSMGVFVAISSGNDSDSTGVEYPAADVSAVSVGSINLDGSISSFSDTGPSLDLLAPGDQVIAPALDPQNNTQVFVYASGTSFSSPIAAGASMLLKQISPNASVDDIVTTLQNTGKSTTEADSGLSFSTIDLFNAVSVTANYVRRHGG